MTQPPPNPGRRKLILSAAAAGALATIGYFGLIRRHGHGALAQRATNFRNRLRIPGASHLLGEASEATDVSGALPIRLQSGILQQPLVDGSASDVWAYLHRNATGAVQLNPTLFARSGSRIRVELENRLGDDTTIHWHGFSVDEANDGSGLHPVRHGERHLYDFEVRNRAGLYWYHAHPHGQTGLQVHKGLAGLVVVEDDEELALQKKLGLTWGVDDIALSVSDKQFGLRNKIVHEIAADDWIGNKVLINWTPDPVFEARRGWLRLRLANTSNARLYRIAFVGGDDKPRPFHLIGVDAGLLPRPYRMESAFLAPAQRLDILLDLRDTSPGDLWMMRSITYEPMENDAGVGVPEDPAMEHPGAVPMGEGMDLMLIRVRDGANGASGALPERLSTYDTGIREDATRRAFRLWLQDSGRWMINHWNFHLAHGEDVFEIKRGSIERWEITNDMRSMPHPMHLHGFQFIVTGRRNSPAQVGAQTVDSRGRTPQDMGLLDTVLVWPGETVSIQIDFAQPYSGRQRYMFHCHNLEHEDQGMMVSFAVVD
ncbi:MAG: multicopper oxidase family protein [Lysobacteraceae bacterium]|nr:MAG: multicopper oxidase family protein [Xanthomonadaceae bacterium]